MGMKHLAIIAERLIAGGRDPHDPVGIVQSGTLAAQAVLETTLMRAAADAEAAGIGTPAVICVGRAVLMRRALDWQALAAGMAPRDVDPLGRGRPAESA